MSEITYPFDPTGLAESNKVTGEQHPVTEVNHRDFYFIIPEFAPFFSGGLVVKHQVSGNTRLLTEGVDYYPALPYMAATRSIGIPLYGAISLNSNINAGIVSIDYQTLGGPWTANRQLVIERIAEKNYNPRLTLWDIVTNIPEIFPPINHPVDVEMIYGQQDLINAINNVADAIANRDRSGLINQLTTG